MKTANWHFNMCDVGSTPLMDIDYAYTDDAILITADPNNWANALHNYEASSNTMGLHTTGLKPRCKILVQEQAQTLST